MTSRPSKAERFRANAGECERRAINSRDPLLKAQFMELANDWRHLAEHVERIAHARQSARKPYIHPGNKDARIVCGLRKAFRGEARHAKWPQHAGGMRAPGPLDRRSDLPYGHRARAL